MADKLLGDMFYQELFQEIASLARRAAETFCSESDLEEKGQIIEVLEDQGDDIVAEVRNRLDQSQDPPFRDPAHVSGLVDGIDNIIDVLKRSSKRIVLYEVTYIPEFIILGGLVLEATQHIEQCIPLLKRPGRNHAKIRVQCMAINQVEERGDDETDCAVSSLLQQTKSGALPELDFHLAKEIVELLEHGLNRCEDLSKLIDTIKKKNL